MPRGITIGAIHYPTKEAARDVCRSIVQRYGIGGDVTDPEDDAFLRHLLERHPEYDIKRGIGISHFRVLAHTGYGRKSVGVAIVRLDGEVADFSWNACLTPPGHRAQVLAALRHAITDHRNHLHGTGGQGPRGTLAGAPPDARRAAAGVEAGQPVGPAPGRRSAHISSGRRSLTHTHRPVSSGAYMLRPPNCPRSVMIAIHGSGSSGSTGTRCPSSGPPCNSTSMAITLASRARARRAVALVAHLRQQRQSGGDPSTDTTGGVLTQDTAPTYRRLPARLAQARREE